jgi:integrase
LLTRGVPVHIVAARLGHTSPVTTMRVYAHVLPKSDVQAAELVGVLLAR